MLSSLLQEVCVKYEVLWAIFFIPGSFNSSDQPSMNAIKNSLPLQLDVANKLLKSQNRQNCLVHFYKRCVSSLRWSTICSFSPKVNEDLISLIISMINPSGGLLVCFGHRFSCCDGYNSHIVSYRVKQPK